MKNKSGFECCFCAKTIFENNFDPCNITIIGNSEINKPKDDRAELLFWSHLECLKEKLNPKTQGYLAVFDSNDDE